MFSAVSFSYFLLSVFFAELSDFSAFDFSSLFSSFFPPESPLEEEEAAEADFLA